MLAEGDRPEVEEFLKALLQGMDRYISDSEAEWGDAPRQFSLFEVIH